MLAVHLLASVIVALVTTVISLTMGHSALTSIVVYVLGGVVGLLGSAMIGATLRHPLRTQPMWQDDDPFLWARIVRTATEEGARGPAPRVLHYRKTATSRSSHGLRGDWRLQPQWAQGEGPWPEEVPEDLRLRLLDATSYASCGPDDIWDEVRAWLVEQGTKRTRASRAPAGA